MDMIYKAVARKKLGQNGQENLSTIQNMVEKAWKYLYRIKSVIFSNSHIHLPCKNENKQINHFNEATQQQIK